MSTANFDNTYVVQQTIRHPSLSNLDEIYTSVASSSTTDTSLCRAYLIGAIVFVISCAISLVPAIYVMTSMRGSEPYGLLTTSDGGDQTLSNWTLCWACNNNNGCCVNIDKSESICNALKKHYSGKLSCVNKDLAIHMLLVSKQSEDCIPEHTIKGWQPVHQSDKTDNITIRNPGLYVLYAKLAYKCSQKNQTALYESQIFVKVNGTKDYILAQHGHRQTEPGPTSTNSESSVCHNAFMIATAYLNRKDIVQVKSISTCRIVSDGKMSYFGYYRIG